MVALRCTHRVGGVVEDGRARGEGGQLGVLVGDQQAAVHGHVFLGDAIPVFIFCIEHVRTYIGGTHTTLVSTSYIRAAFGHVDKHNNRYIYFIYVGQEFARKGFNLFTPATKKKRYLHMK